MIFHSAESSESIEKGQHSRKGKEIQKSKKSKETQKQERRVRLDPPNRMMSEQDAATATVQWRTAIASRTF